MTKLKHNFIEKEYKKFRRPTFPNGSFMENNGEVFNDFYFFGTSEYSGRVDDDVINKWINKGLSIMEQNEDIDYWFSQAGDSMVILLRCDENGIQVIVSKIPIISTVYSDQED